MLIVLAGCAAAPGAIPKTDPKFQPASQCAARIGVFAFAEATLAERVENNLRTGELPRANQKHVAERINGHPVAPYLKIVGNDVGDAGVVEATRAIATDIANQNAAAAARNHGDKILSTKEILPSLAEQARQACESAGYAFTEIRVDTELTARVGAPSKFESIEPTRTASTGVKATTNGDLVKAARDLAVTAGRRDGRAALKLGQILEQGQGDKNRVEATYWYRIAADDKDLPTAEAAVAAIERLGGVYAPRPVLVDGKPRSPTLTAKQFQEQMAFIDQLARDRFKAAPGEADHFRTIEQGLLIADMQFVEVTLGKQSASRDLSDAERQDLAQLAGLLPGAMQRLDEKLKAAAEVRADAVLAKTMRVDASEFTTTVRLRGKTYELRQVPDDSEWAAWSLDAGFARNSGAEPVYFLQVIEKYVSNRPRNWTVAATDRAQELEFKTIDREVVAVQRNGVLVRETTMIQIPAELLGGGQSPRNFAVRLANTAGQTLTLDVPSSIAMDTWKSAQVAAKRYRK
jgi:TPR repeat protein